MIVTIGGAYRNSGDHLIGDRARALLRRFVDEDVVAVDRRKIDDSAYDLFNRARAVMLAGGPAYQRKMYPAIYPLERGRVRVPIIPYGLGWKAPVGKTIESFEFAPEALDFIKDVHSGIELSSVRDPLTLDVLNHIGVSNVLMTGCPAWYDLEYFDTPFRFPTEVKTLVLSMPAVMQPGVFELMEWLTREFPKARRVASFHHGIIPATTSRGLKVGRQNAAFALSALRRGWSVASLAGSLKKMERLYTAADLHIGYRVHAHLLCLSRRRSSILINEDARGVGQARALDAGSLTVGKGGIEPYQKAVHDHLSSGGRQVESSIEIMRATLPTMQRFLATV